MARQSTHHPSPNSIALHGWKRVVASLAGLPLALAVDYFTPLESSVAIFYLAAVGIAAWIGGLNMGILVSICSVAGGLLIRAMGEPLKVSDLWNTGVWAGIYLTFCILLVEVRIHNRDFPIFRILRRSIIATFIVACTLALSGLLVEQKVLAWRQARSTRHDVAAVPAVAAPVAPLTRETAANLLIELTLRISGSLEQSRPVLLGSRDPNGPSCVPVLLGGQVTQEAPPSPADLDGGPGTRMGLVYFYDRQSIKSPMQDFIWHQTRLRTFLENQRTANQDAMERAERSARRAATLADGIAAWASLPNGFESSSFTSQDDWPSYCLSALNSAIRARDLPGAQRWSAELASATFALHDLHRWLDFLLQNELAALDFQRRCESLYTWADPLMADYTTTSAVAQFPAGLLSHTAISNYYEVERQAEGLFATPASQSLGAVPAAAVWMPPEVRDSFLKLEEVLSPANQATWEQSARTPYDRSFMVNMLYRTGKAGAIDALRASLRKFNANHPNASEDELMGVLPYRGHCFAGLEWGDRYIAPLLDAGQKLQGTEPQLLMSACAWTNNFYRTPVEYIRNYTLRDALASRKLDCIRSTDMIGAIFRNAGGTRFAHVWLCGGTISHSIAAYMQKENDQCTVLAVDGMNPPEQPEVWPQAWFHGHPWPEAIKNEPPAYATELYVRGLDNYVWAEGYIIRGPNAGTQEKTAVPYFPLRQERSARKVFEGPYPQ